MSHTSPHAEPVVSNAPDANRTTPHYDRFLDCIHCGLCLPSCPTYAELGVEMDSPRGRIYLMRAYADGRIGLTDNFVRHIYQCLDCRACETACPSGVHYGSIVERARAEIEKKRPQTLGERILRNLVFQKLLPASGRLSLAFLPLRLYQGLGVQRLVRAAGLTRLLPQRLRDMESMLPRLPSRSLKNRLKPVLPAKGEKKYRVGLVSGCVMNEMFTHINVATANVLTRNGCEVVIPEKQTCCGALQVHSGERATAEELARKNIETFEQAAVDTVIINAAGCGAQLKEYGELLEDDPQFRDRAAAFSAKVRDISEFLAEIPLDETLGRIDARVAYHDACHLAHGQKVRSQPRALLRKIPGIQLVELEESDWCCGSAGIYNVTHPEMAGRLLDRKVGHIRKADPDIVATGNPGCILQIQNGVGKERRAVEVLHPVELLDRAYSRKDEVGRIK
ncbi:MAG: 4Fe-4S dicluster domain-containing protein [candidate division Zixibacteria bacterium]|nr:4Fe-4S dicluster domain-containing protein [candidate division Zixibacteria bacterium]